MTFAYSHELGEKAMQAAADCGLKLHQGCLLYTSFADGADIQAWARSDVYWAYNSGVMNGVSGNRFAPNNSYTHEQDVYKRQCSV